MSAAVAATALVLSGCSSDDGPGPGSITVVVGGDLIPQSAIIDQARTDAGGSGYDFMPMLRALKPFVSGADLSICQLEGTLAPNNDRLTAGIRHRGPTEFARAVRSLGYDGCSTANNHTFDSGRAGLGETHAVLKKAGLQAAGPGPDADHPTTTAWYDVKGFKVAQLSYSYNLDNKHHPSASDPPADAPWLRRSLLWATGVKGIERDARAAREKGADVVIVSMHWGEQFHFEPSPEQLKFGPALLRSPDVDLVVGNHAHVVQRCDKVNGKYVLYALGNQISDQGTNWGFPAATQDSATARVTVERDDAGKITTPKIDYLPTWTDRLGKFRVKVTSSTAHRVPFERTVRAMKGTGNSCKATVASG